MASRSPRICPAHMWPWAAAASSTYSSKDFMREVAGVSKYSQHPLRELDDPIFIVPVLLVFDQRDIHFKVALEEHTHRARPRRCPLHLHGQLVHRWAAIARIGTQFLGPHAHPNAIAFQFSRKIRAVELVAIEPQQAGVSPGIEGDDFGLHDVVNPE